MFRWVIQNYPKAIANAINSHFVSMSANVSIYNRLIVETAILLISPRRPPALKSIRGKSKKHYLSDRVKRNTAPGPDGISARIVHDFSFELATP